MESVQQSQFHTNELLLIGQNAVALAENIPLDGVHQQHVGPMRTYVLQQLMENAQIPPNKRDVCDMVGCRKPGRRDRWICCHVCGRWCHFTCADVQDVPSCGYICTICNAQYM